MEQKIENKLILKDKLKSIYQIHKIKIIILSFMFGIILITSVFIQQKNKKNNILIAEKYIQAGLSLSLNKTVEAKILLNEIILSKNKFYSVLALNNILEKNLIDNDEQILNYFNILEDLDLNEDELDLIIFKKALYLLKKSNNSEGKKLLEKLVKKNSKFKNLAEEAISN